MVTLAAEMLELLVTIHPVIDERGQNSMPVHQSCVAGMALPVPIEAVLHESKLAYDQALESCNLYGFSMLIAKELLRRVERLISISGG